VQAKHYRWEDLPREALNPLLTRRLIATERMMVSIEVMVTPESVTFIATFILPGR